MSVESTIESNIFKLRQWLASVHIHLEKKRLTNIYYQLANSPYDRTTKIPLSKTVLIKDDLADLELSSSSDDSVLPNFLLDKRGNSQLLSKMVICNSVISSTCIKF